MRYETGSSELLLSENADDIHSVGDHLEYYITTFTDAGNSVPNGTPNREMTTEENP